MEAAVVMEAVTAAEMVVAAETVVAAATAFYQIRFEVRFRHRRHRHRRRLHHLYPQPRMLPTRVVFCRH